MIFYKILFFTLSTVSIIHCTQLQSNQNEDSNASYHIEFEDKSPNGGYGYKVQVSGKNKFQETWNKQKNTAHTAAPVVTLDYSQNNYASSTQNFIPKVESSTKSVESNSYLSNSATVNSSNNLLVHQNQQSRKPAFQPSPLNSVTFKGQQINQAQSLNKFVPQAKPVAQNIPNEQFNKPPYISPNNFASHEVSHPEFQAALQNSLNSQTYNINKSPVQYSSSNDFVPITQHESKSKLSQNNFSPQNFGTNNHDWQIPSKSNFVPSSQYSNKPSVQIMNQQYTVDGANFDVSSYNGPEVFVESTSGKLNHNQFTNQYESKPQVALPSEADLSSYYLQNPNVLQHDSIKSFETPQTVQIQYYQPTSHSNENTDYKSLIYGAQYASQVPSVPSTHGQEAHLSDNIKYSQQFVSPISLNQYIQETPHSNQNNAQEPIVSSGQNAPYVYPKPSNPFVSGQEIKHSKGKTVHKSSSYTVKKAPQYQPSSLTQFAPAQNIDYKQYAYQFPSVPETQESIGHAQENIPYKPSLISQYASQFSSVPTSQVPTASSHSLGNNPSTLSNQYVFQLSSVPEAQFSPQGSGHAQESIHYNPTVLKSQYATGTPSIPLTHLSSQQNLKYVPEQNIDYSQLLQQYPVQFTQGEALQTIPLNEISQQNLHKAAQHTGNKNEVSKQSKQVKNIPSVQSDYSQVLQQYPLQFSQEDLASLQSTPNYIPQQNVQAQHPANNNVINYKQESANSVKQQNINSAQLPTDYSQLVQQYPVQFSQGDIVSLQTDLKGIPQQNSNSAVQHPAIKNVVYHYKQELPPTTSQRQPSISSNNLNTHNYVTLNSNSPNDFSNTYNTVLSGYGQQSLSGLSNNGNKIPLSPYAVYESVENGKDNNQNQFAHGLSYGYGSQAASGHGLFNGIGNNGHLGGFQYGNTFNTLRRSSGKIGKDKKYVADQKQTE